LKQRFVGPRFWMIPLLVGVNIAVFLFQSLLSERGLLVFEHVFGLSRAGVEAGYWWEYITYAFLHANWFHLGVNMLLLWAPGRLIERFIGPWRTLLLYIFGAVGGGLLQMLMGPQLLLGASGAVCGIIVAFSAFFPSLNVLLLLFFVLPLELRAKYLGWGLIVSSLLLLIFDRYTPIGHAAHLGGALAGFLFARVSGFSRLSPVENWLFRKRTE